MFDLQGVRKLRKIVRMLVLHRPLMAIWFSLCDARDVLKVHAPQKFNETKPKQKQA